MFIIWTTKEYKLVTLQPIYMLSATNFKLQNYLSLGNHLSKQKNGTPPPPPQQHSQANVVEILRKLQCIERRGWRGSQQNAVLPSDLKCLIQLQKEKSHIVGVWPADNLSLIPWSCDWPVWQILTYMWKAGHASQHAFHFTTSIL